jgi:glyoxylate reductase
VTTNKPVIFVTQPILPEGLSILESIGEVHQNDRGRPLTEDEMVEIATTLNPDAYVGTFAEPHRVFSARVIEASKRLQVIAWNGLGYDHIDPDAATARGIYVTYVEFHCATVSDHAFALMICAARKIVPAAQAVKAGEWERQGTFFNMNFVGTNIHNRTLGIVGLGRVGGGLARRAFGFDMRILYCDEVPRTALEAQLGVERVSFDDLLRQSDFVCCCVPLTAGTQRMFDATAFAKMQPSAMFVNVTRGACVDTDALYAALRDRRIEFAALDVIEPEPLPTDHPILRLDNVLLAPHIAGLTRETRSQAHIITATDCVRVLQGYRPQLVLNPAVEKVRPLPEFHDTGAG